MGFEVDLNHVRTLIAQRLLRKTCGDEFLPMRKCGANPWGVRDYGGYAEEGQNQLQLSCVLLDIFNPPVDLELIYFALACILCRQSGCCALFPKSAINFVVHGLCLIRHSENVSSRDLTP